jgi:hypothetical protein
MAYTLEWNGTYAGATTGSGWDADKITFSNGSYANTVTQFIRGGPTYTPFLSGTYSGGIYHNYGGGVPSTQGTLVGNGTISWSCTGTANYYDTMCTYTYSITDITALPAGPQTVRYGTFSGFFTDANGVMCNNGGCFAKRSADAPPSDVTYPKAITSMHSTTGLVFNGTYFSYSGSGVPVIPPANATPIRTYIQAVDGTNGGSIHGANINIKNVLTGAWTNYTSDADGTGYIDTLSNATIEAYSDYTGFSSASRSNLTPFDGVYELVMWPGGSLPDPGTGNVNLIVIVNDKATSAPISGATVKFTPPTGATQGATTNSAGTYVFQVPNMSVISLGVTFPSGSPYLPASTSITTSAFGPDTKRIEVSKNYVTPTGTIAGDINGDGVVDDKDVPGATPVRTILPGCEDPTSSACASAQDDQMARDVRGWIMLLIPICGLVTLMYLFGFKLGA